LAEGSSGGSGSVWTLVFRAEEKEGPKMVEVNSTAATHMLENGADIRVDSKTTRTCFDHHDGNLHARRD
jgi:hypothetical protein